MPQRKVTRVEFPVKATSPSQPLPMKQVAAYARVSTVKDAQENSLQSQQEYFTEYIRHHPDWVFAGMYTDDGVSGLSIRKRDGFNRMVNDALDGKIDLILTKSLSRFARNTVDALTTIRKLKAAGVAVYFQRENINTMDSTGEFLITLMSSFAEEESRSISENVTWAVRHRYAQGIYHLPGQFLGYRRSPVGEIQVDEAGGRVVRFIYLLALAGASSTDICRILIMTFDSKGELLITIMSSLAQEESRSISENVTWGQRKRFSDGKVSIPYGQFLGYRKGADGLPEIVPEEAKIVRRIYRELLQGKSTNAITAMLTEEGIPTPGKKTVWQRATVESILRNEKYKGSALLQKSFTVDFLTKKTKINEGEVPQYYVEDSHPSIIEPWEWEQVQAELERRKNSRTRHRQTSPFSGKIFCADCGEIFGAKTWHSTDRYRRVVWQCNGKFKGERKCETPHLTEEQLKELFLAALGEYLSDRDAAIDQLRCAQRTLTDTDFIDADIQALEEELTGVTGMLRLCIEENAANTTTEEAYRTTHADLCRRFEETEAKLAALKRQREKMKADAVAIGGMMFELGELDALPLTFDEKLWNGTVDHVTVHADERVVFRFKDGKEITTRL